MSNATIARREIDEKYKKLNRNGLNLGASKSGLKDLDHGGWVRIYEHGRIYWHSATGAHEVHGGILQAYLERGGPDRNPKTGNRDLKFPTSDEHVTGDGRFPVSIFEEGVIYWLSGRGGVAIYGDIYHMYLQLGGGMGRLGYPVTDPLQVGGLEVAYFERGCLWMNPDTGSDVSVFYFDDIPQLGRPAMLNKSDSSTFTFESVIRSTVSSEERKHNIGKDRVAKQKRIRKTDDNFPLPPPGEGGPIDEGDLPGDGGMPNWVTEILVPLKPFGWQIKDSARPFTSVWKTSPGNITLFVRDVAENQQKDLKPV